MDVRELLSEPNPGPAKRGVRLKRAEKAIVVAWKLLLAMTGEPIRVRELFDEGELTGFFNSWGDAAGNGEGGLGLERDGKGCLLRTRPNFVRCAHALRNAGTATA